MEEATRTLANAGARLKTVATPDGFENIAAHHRTIAGYEFARAITWERTQHAPLLSPKLVEGRCADGLRSTYEDHASAQEALSRQRISFAALMQSYDAIITPVAPGEAWQGLGATGTPVFNTAWTALHVPALSIPAFTGPTGMPVGLQLVGKLLKDAALLAAAQAVCNALDIGILRSGSVPSA